MKRKILSKLVLGVLISSTLVGSFTRASYARSVESVQAIQDVSDVATISGEDLTNIIEKFQNIQGDEVDGELTIIKADGYVGKINKDTGDITHETYDENGVLVDSYTTNFYDNLENITSTRDLQNIETRQTIISGDIAYKLSGLYYNVSQYGSVQKFYGQNSKNKTKSFDLRGSYIDNSSIKEFVYNVDRASSKSRLFVSYTGVNVALNLIAVLGLVFPSVAAVKQLLISLGILDGGVAIIAAQAYGDFISYNDLADTDFKFLSSR